MEKVIFESIIKTNPIGRWFIEIRDTSEGGESQVCLDINEYATKIEDMGAEYGGNVEVAWSQEENVTPVQINEVRMEMKAYEQKLKKEQENPNTSHEINGSQKF